ncbi:similar to Saccharomyces cerevisiae YKL146W AVT3 Vacuolar transporter, exports large neutral amino acids from the vacuole [Maudiozyma saulgeensis]|uniref:Similar to Saccharomyces cerevisiae YKL146W AVT3 Vacuolar transporter, exports large neutral amino acids from the vacuole n=1 Tax=Maudiozyma saulgeensis TaxID=1789683 RepID=A0A1X7R4Y8_9SACH|nr:similar to Saccharomyces cerevisiae YKL146W AVT3 Vacuolar transporter, exports large neutral amino acids from the vacuole [Kazachstania saulgeensis]
MARKDNRKKKAQRRKKKSANKIENNAVKQQQPIMVTAKDLPPPSSLASIGATDGANNNDPKASPQPFTSISSRRSSHTAALRMDPRPLHVNNSNNNNSTSIDNSNTSIYGTTPLKQQPQIPLNLSNSGTPNVSKSASFDLNNPTQDVVDQVSKYLSPSTNDLSLPGGDITRDLYKWKNDHPSILENNNSSNSNVNNTNNNNNSNLAHSPIRTTNLFPENNYNNNNTIVNCNASHRKRSMSFSALSINSSTLNSLILPTPHGRTYSGNNNNNIGQNNGNGPVIMTHEEIRAPGGFRRSYILHSRRKKNLRTPDFFTRNFIEFLTLYGHFAGEDLSDSDSEREEDGEEDENVITDLEVLESDTESTSLLLTETRSHAEKHKSSTFKAVLLLLKSFVGTGVLFLPRAFHNGGWAFSSLCLLFCAWISYYCFILLINTKNKINVNGYGEMGFTLYGNSMKYAILASITLSQLGFAAAYTVFTATNLKVFVDNVFGFNKEQINLAIYIILQAIIFIPLSLTRNIAKLSGTALIADLFILLGLLYVYYYASYYVVTNGVAQSMILFNKQDWSLFIGTAIFTFEGIGLLIPIQESMRHPEKFQKSLSGVMVIVTVIFISCGLICYCAFGAKVETVVLLNFPQDSSLTLIVQLLYALAILLSTPLQLFPAIRILEHWTFPANASGKHNPKVKWLKNYFRTFVVILSATMAWIGANDLDKFVSLVGSLACIPLIYIHPPLLHFKATMLDTSSPLTMKMKLEMVLDIVLCVFGVCVMAYTSWQTIAMWVS